MKRVSQFFLLCAAVLLVGVGCSSNDAGFAGAAGVFLTTDNGETWTQKSILPNTQGPQSLAGLSVYRMYEDPQDPDALYWASREAGLFYTYNGGESWRQAPAPLSSGFIFSVAVHPQNKCIIFATNGSRIYKSIDCNRTFEEVHREERGAARITSLEFHGFQPYELFVTKQNGDILVSSDLGVSWQIAKRQSKNLVHIESDPFVADRMYLTTRNNGLFRSDDRGRTWDNLSSAFDGFAGAKEYRRFVMDTGNEGHLYWVSTYGILRSTDSGDTWEAIRLITSPGSAQIYSLAVNPKNNLELYYTATIGNRSIFYSSQDGGVNWTTESLPSGQVPTTLHQHSTDPDRLYLGMTIPPQE